MQESKFCLTTRKLVNFATHVVTICYIKRFTHQIFVIFPLFLFTENLFIWLSVCVRFMTYVQTVQIHNKNSAKGYVAPGKEHVPMTYIATVIANEFLIFAHCPLILYICIKICENIS